MKEKCQIASDEWFIPKNWERGSIQSVFEEKDGVIAEAQKLLEKVKQLKGAIVEDKFNMLLTQFNNLYYAARVWRGLLDVLYYYVKFFETGEQIFENKLFESLEDIKNTDEEGRRVVGDNDDYYMNIGCFSGGEGMHVVKQFAADVKESFFAEKNAYARMRNQPVPDFVICGGAMEGHKLQKEVNFSDTLNVNGRPCRIPGNKNGAEWSRVNAHGWFSYCLNIKPYAENKIIFDFGSLTDKIDVQITVGDEIFNFDRTAKESEFTIVYEENKGENSLRVRIDRVSGHTPLLYTIIVK